jgi:hypothetical protein
MLCQWFANIKCQRSHECERGTMNARCHLVFPRAENWTENCGADPWSARVPHGPAGRQFSSIQTKQADEGVGCGPGGPPRGPPHLNAKCAISRKLTGIAQGCVRHTLATHHCTGLPISSGHTSVREKSFNSRASSAGVPTRAGNVPKCIGTTFLTFSKRQASAASRGPMV